MNCPIAIDRTSLFQMFGVLGGIFYFYAKFIEYSVSKQLSPWSDASFCGEWSGSALFAYVQQKGR